MTAGLALDLRFAARRAARRHGAAPPLQPELAQHNVPRRTRRVPTMECICAGPLYGFQHVLLGHQAASVRTELAPLADVVGGLQTAGAPAARAHGYSRDGQPCQTLHLVRSAAHRRNTHRCSPLGCNTLGCNPLRCNGLTHNDDATLQPGLVQRCNIHCAAGSGTAWRRPAEVLLTTLVNVRPAHT